MQAEDDIQNPNSFFFFFKENNNTNSNRFLIITCLKVAIIIRKTLTSFASFIECAEITIQKTRMESGLVRRQEEPEYFCRRLRNKGLNVLSELKNQWAAVFFFFITQWMHQGFNIQHMQIGRQQYRAEQLLSNFVFLLSDLHKITQGSEFHPIGFLFFVRAIIASRNQGYETASQECSFF